MTDELKSVWQWHFAKFSFKNYRHFLRNFYYVKLYLKQKIFIVDQSFLRRAKDKYLKGEKVEWKGGWLMCPKIPGYFYLECASVGCVEQCGVWGEDGCRLSRVRIRKQWIATVSERIMPIKPIGRYWAKSKMAEWDTEWARIVMQSQR